LRYRLLLNKFVKDREWNRIQNHISEQSLVFYVGYFVRFFQFCNGESVSGDIGEIQNSLENTRPKDIFVLLSRSVENAPMLAYSEHSHLQW